MQKNEAVNFYAVQLVNKAYNDDGTINVIKS